MVHLRIFHPSAPLGIPLCSLLLIVEMLDTFWRFVETSGLFSIQQLFAMSAHNTLFSICFIGFSCSTGGHRIQAAKRRETGQMVAGLIQGTLGALNASDEVVSNPNPKIRLHFDRYSVNTCYGCVSGSPYRYAFSSSIVSLSDMSHVGLRSFVCLFWGNTTCA